MTLPKNSIMVIESIFWQHLFRLCQKWTKINVQKRISQKTFHQKINKSILHVKGNKITHFKHFHLHSCSKKRVKSH